MTQFAGHIWRRVHAAVSEDLWDQMERFRVERGLENTSETIRVLLAAGLESNGFLDNAVFRACVVNAKAWVLARWGALMSTSLEMLNDDADAGGMTMSADEMTRINRSVVGEAKATALPEEDFELADTAESEDVDAEFGDDEESDDEDDPESESESEPEPEELEEEIGHGVVRRRKPRKA